MSRCAKFVFLCTVAALLPRLVAAQVLMKLQIEHAQLVRYESVNAFISILNESPHQLTFGGKDGARLSFFIEHERDTSADRITQKPLAENVNIEPGTSLDILRDISRWYDLGPVGNYSIRAIIEWRGESYQSNRVRIDVVNGLPISSEKRTIWNEEEFVREFSLCYLAREGTERLFLSIDDKRAGISYGVFDLGGIIRLHPPVIRISREGNVRVLHQSGFGRYTLNKLEVTSDKVHFVDQSYIGEDGKPLNATEMPSLENPEAEFPPKKPEEPERKWWPFRRQSESE